MFTASGINLTSIGDNFITELGHLQGVLEYALAAEVNPYIRDSISRKLEQLRRTEQAWYGYAKFQSHPVDIDLAARVNERPRLQIIQGGKS